jgi:hypothetical protein
VLLGIPQPKLSKVLRGRFHGFSERKLTDSLTLLGRDIDIVVRMTPKGRGQGAVSVSFAQMTAPLLGLRRRDRDGTVCRGPRDRGYRVG